MTPEQRKVRQRLYDDFPFYAENALFIRTKDQKIAPFRLNEAQRRLLAEIDRQIALRGFVRIVILKGRQMGLSTCVGGWLYWWVSQRMAQKAMVIAHEGQATSTLFDMTKRYHDRAPAILKPSTKYSSKRELVFDVLDSAYTVRTAGGDAIARSETITAAHLSEVAFWPKSSAQDNFSGLMDTIPSKPGTAVFIESTANGLSGIFYEQWKTATEGRSAFFPLFLPWFIDTGYTAPVPEGFARSPDEERIASLYGLDDGQLMFRRLKIAEKGEDLFKQEYPLCADEAFLTSGRPVFHPERVVEMLSTAKEPLRRECLFGEVWTEDRRGELSVYRELDPRETYYIGADVGAGVQKDWSVAHVFDSSRRQVAVWRSDRYDADAFGTVLAALGRRYTEARIICERNNHGILTNRVLTKDEGYSNYYTETIYDKVSDKETTHVGFFTSEKSKPLIINQLRAHVREREIEIYDRTTLEEMQAFVVSDNGRMEAEKGCHDDCVMSLALADHINEGAMALIENTDEFYIGYD